jgi:hypothetical protein
LCECANRTKSAVGAEGLTFPSHCVIGAGLSEARIAADLRDHGMVAKIP